MVYEHDTIHQALGAHQAHGVGRVTVYLTDRDSAWNPSDESQQITGPATVLYELDQRDGLVTAYIDGGRG
jgi:hypothetical protein